VGTVVTDSVQPIRLEAPTCQALTDVLQPLLASAPLLTLALLVAVAPDHAAADALSTVKLSMDTVEEALIACLRQSDLILRCGEGSCVAVLLGADVEGALYALHRFRSRLGKWMELAVPLQVGVASAPEQATDTQSLLALATRPRLRLLPAADAEEGRMPRLEEIEPEALGGLLPSGGMFQKKRGKAPQQAPGGSMPAAPALARPSPRPLLRSSSLARSPETLALARARALGIPYLAPPQRIPSSVRNLVPPDVMRQLQCLPIGRERNALTVALADPTDRRVLRRLEQITGLTIFPVMTDPDVLEELAKPTRPRRASQAISAQSSGD